MARAANTISIDQFKKLTKTDKGSSHKNPHAIGQTYRPGRMNKTEQAFYNDIVQPGLAAGEFLFARFEPITLVLAHKHNKECKFWGMRYKPDFMLMREDRSMLCVDVKGYGRPIEEDSLVKIKAAAEIFWMFYFVIATKHRGTWHFEEI